MSDASSRLPNLYQLLGLPALESDLEKIDSAVGRLRSRIASQNVTNGSTDRAAEAQRIQKVVALAQKYLLDPKRKAAYDQQWQLVYQVQPAADKLAPSVAPTLSSSAKSASPAKANVSAVSAMKWDTSRLDQMLPKGDPQAAFDMAAFLRTSETRDPLAVERDVSRLIALLSSEESQAAAELGVSSTTLSNTQLIGELGHHDSVGEMHRSQSPDRQMLSTGGSLAKRLQKRRQRSLIIGGVVMFAGIAGLIMLGLFLLSGPPQGTRQQLVQRSSPKQAPKQGSGLPKVDLENLAAEGRSQDRPPVSSGLPQPGQGNAMLEIDITTATAQSQQPMVNETSASDSASSSVAAGAAPTPTAIPEAPDSKTPGNPNSPRTGPEMMASSPVAQPTSAAAAAEGAVMPDAKPTAEEKQTWHRSMNEAKGLIGKHDFDGADKKLAGLKESAKTALQRGQLERLQQVSSFVKDIRQAMVDAIRSMDAADTFKIGRSTTAAFVEGDETRITVRVSGARHSHALEEMPVAMGLALVDLKMDIAHAQTLARKGAYIAVHPKNSLTLERAKQLLAEAAAAGAISAELAKFYEDDYSLSQLGD